MAIITISRQMAAFGDEVSSLVAKKLNYKFLGKKELEEKIVRLGFPESKLQKYDEKLPAFFANLIKDRDEYLDYLQTAILESAVENNCVFVGRGAFIILGQLQNHLSFRIIAPENIRISRTVSKLKISEKSAKKKLLDSDKNRLGFHKSFFNYQIDDPSLYHAVINTGLFDIDCATDFIAGTVNSVVSKEKENLGTACAEELLICQRIVNMLVLDYNLNINFMRATCRNGKITLHGTTDSAQIAKKALVIARAELPQFKVDSALQIVRDF